MDSTIEITSRFRSILGRLGDLQGPFVGVSIPGDEPFVVRRKLIDSVVSTLVDVEVEFIRGDSEPYLQIKGRSSTGGRHISKIVNLRDRGRLFDLNVEWNRWADSQKRTVKKSRRKGGTIAISQDERKRQKVDAKIRKLDAEISKLERRIASIRSERPVNPLLEQREVREWDRSKMAQIYAERSKRRLISKLAARFAAHYEQRQSRKAVTVTEQVSLFDEPERKTVYEMVTDAVWKPFTWKQFYVEIERRGIHIHVPYDRARGRQGGPSSPEEYCRSMQWIGLENRRWRIWEPEDGREGFLKRMQSHAEDRKAYIHQQREVRSLEMTIASLREMRASHEAELVQVDEVLTSALAA